jgi:hypothetical protein
MKINVQKLGNHFQDLLHSFHNALKIVETSLKVNGKVAGVNSGMGLSGIFPTVMAGSLM